MLRIIKELKPSYIIGENVAGLLSMENGKTLEGILIDLENEGYQTETFIIPACAVGAWHRRDRIWIIAYNGSRNTWCRDESKQAKMRRHEPRQNSKTSSSFSRQDNSGGISKRELETTRTLENVPNTYSSGHIHRKSKEQSAKRGGESQHQLEPSYTHEDVPNTTGKRLQKPGQAGIRELQTENRERMDNRFTKSNRRTIKSELGGMVDGLSPWLYEPNIPRIETGIKNRTGRLKGLGNAIVPQIAYELFKAIKEGEFA